MFSRQPSYTEMMCVFFLHMDSIGRIPEANKDALLPYNPECYKRRTEIVICKFSIIKYAHKSKNCHLDFFKGHMEGILHG